MDGHLTFLGGHPPTQGWSPTRRKCKTRDLEFGTYTSLTKLTTGDNYHGWSPNIPILAPTHPRKVTHKPRDGHPSEESVLKKGNFALRFNSQN